MLKENLIEMMEESFKENWDVLALSDYFKEDRYTYGQMAEEIAWLHILFNKLKIKKGDKISIIGRNNTRWCISCLAVMTYGAVAVPILQDFSSNDVQHILNHSDSVLLFSSVRNWEAIDTEQLKGVKAVLSLENFKPLWEHSGNLVQRLVEEGKEKLMQKYYPNDFTRSDIKYAKVPNEGLILINYTSGTTGYSKGVMLSVNNLTGNIVYGKNHHFHYSGSRSLSFLPLAHAYGCAFDFLLPLTCGGTIILLGKIPTPKVLMEAFAKVKPNLILSVPLILEKIYRKQILPKMDKFFMKIACKIPYLRGKIYAKIRDSIVNAMGGEFAEFIVGGASLSKEAESFFQKIKFPITVGYGMTECGPLIAYENWDKFKPRSCGKILERFMEAKIDSPDPRNVPGEILVKGENVMMGYYKNEEETKRIISDGWLHTGDMGVIDEDDNLYIKGRCKDMILSSNGQNIYPEEIEAKLNNLPCVMESLVIKRDGKMIALVYPNYDQVDEYNVRNSGLEELMEENRKVLNTQIASYEAIQKIIIQNEEFEKTPKKSIKRYLYTLEE